MTTYKRFVQEIKDRGLTLEQLRCDVPPTQDILDFMSVVGTDSYERFVLRYERSQPKQFRCSVCQCDLVWDRPSGVCSTACLNRAQGFQP